MSGFSQTLFPDPPRSFPGQRGVKILLRAVHVLCAGLLVGAHVFESGADDQTLWLVATATTGAALFLLDLGETAAFLLQARGLVVLVKIGLTASVPALGTNTTWVLITVFLGAVLMSHAPSKVRYHMLVAAGRVRGAETKG